MIGVPIADLDVYVLDQHQQFTPVGVTGEIYVGGAGVARGYLDRPELTRERFINDPVDGTDSRLLSERCRGRWLPNGELELCGRLDQPIEPPGRVEIKPWPLRRCPLGRGDMWRRGTISNLRSSMIWASVLGCEVMGVEDNFFELGGDSMSTIQVIARSRQLGLHVTTRDVFTFPTIAALGAAIAVRIRAAADSGRRSECGDADADDPLVSRTTAFDRNHWNEAILLNVPSSLDVGALDIALTAVVDRHDVFRLRLREDAAGWHAGYVPTHPRACVERVDLKDYPAEMIRRPSSRRRLRFRRGWTSATVQSCVWCISRAPPASQAGSSS